ncbi:hypothetical protein KP509_31G017000 [Ceratopteris richardii]|uniref:Alpha 1,4-glycosyltransferase domain-containing protein n=1 Tax=Ceratopteris richardii TaxID=49495 RepID=A0A8T2QX96_CERRI|nr:hypothetical protein KP509_31G017000 [Ceratopteris richardii]
MKQRPEQHYVLDETSYQRQQAPSRQWNPNLVALGLCLIVTFYLLSRAVHLPAEFTVAYSSISPLLSEPQPDNVVLLGENNQESAAALRVYNALMENLDNLHVSNSGRLDSSVLSQGEPDVMNLNVSRSKMSSGPFHVKGNYEQLHDNDKADKAQKASEVYNLSDRKDHANYSDHHCVDRHGDDCTSKKFNPNNEIIEIPNIESPLFNTSEVRNLSSEWLQSKRLETESCQTEKMTANENKRSSNKAKRSSSPLLISRVRQSINAQLSESIVVADGVKDDLENIHEQKQPLKYAHANFTNELNFSVDEKQNIRPITSNSISQAKVTQLLENFNRSNILYKAEHADRFSQRIRKFLSERVVLGSVFKLHPNACLVILSQTFDSPDGRLMLSAFSKRGFSVLGISPNIPFLLEETPAQAWWNNLLVGRIDPGTISIYQNLSNLLRLAVLYKYGGIYIDSDIIVMKSFANLRNVIGAQSVDPRTGKWSRLNNAVLVFDKQNPLLFKFIQEFSTAFNGSMWGYNGPYLVSRVIRKESNSGVQIMDPQAFYPVDFLHIQSFFKAPRDHIEQQWIRAKIRQLREHSYTLHLWNKLSRNMAVEPESIMDGIFRHVCIHCEF